MKRITLAAALLAAVSLPVMAQQSQTKGQSSAPSQSRQATASKAAQNFVQKASAGDQFELMTSRLALQKAQSADVKSFAQRMVDDHTMNAQELASVASQSGIAMAQGGSTMGSSSGTSGLSSDSTRGPTARGSSQGGTVGSTDTTGSTTSTMNAGDMNARFDAKQRQALDRLQNASGAEFDRLYVQAQTEAHRDAVSLYQSYAKSGDNAALKSFAQKMLPALLQHEAELKRIQPRAS